MLQWRRETDGEGRCNRAVIVSVGRFHPGVDLCKRPGAEKDAKRLHRTLSKLGFRVDVHSDLSGEDIYQLFDRESRRPVKDCFLSVLSSHGEDGCVFGADGEPVWLSRVFSCFNNQLMEKQAKLFLIQACRGHELDNGVEVDSVSDAHSNNFSTQLHVPVDTTVMYATTAGHGAFMHPLGSVFLQTFCSLLESEGNRELELLRLLTRLSHRVAYTFQAKGHILGGKKAMPCLVTRLTRDVFPFADPQKKDAEGAGLRATSLVDSDKGRKRSPSIS
ncbi:caspase-7-like [Solea solea]|uniref:caspase-7-like n=1 Tax=Solea solea TaxID=90069 RepID=UPI00272C53DA|nr:caspase-7-like [Solea solea]XP_058473115.1 caspase-7-like [Solea solea]